MKDNVYILCFFVSICVVNTNVTVFTDENSHIYEDNGYYLDDLNEVGLANIESDVLECPTNNVITTRYKCKVNDKWVDCTRKHCCKDYIYLLGRCIHKDDDPCSMGFCEQVCTVYLQRVICTCHEGYKYKPENQKLGIKPVCVDTDECLDNNGDCQHECVNEVGDHRCTCRKGFLLSGDNRTCIPQETNVDLRNSDSILSNVQSTSSVNEEMYPMAGQQQAANRRNHCYANCDTVSRLHDRLKALQEKVSALSTAIKLSNMASGPPGPPGPTGPQGPQGPRGFGGGAETSSNVHGNQDYTYSLLDGGGFVPLGEGEAYCRCKRGPQGDIGATGIRGPKGDKGIRGSRGPRGEAGSIDLILLLLADIRYDVVHLQNKVYANGEKPPKYDFQIALQNKSQKDKNRLEKQQQLLQGYLSPPIESAMGADGTSPILVQTKPTTSTTTETPIEEFQDNIIFITEDDNDYLYEDETTSSQNPENTNNDYYYEVNT